MILLFLCYLTGSPSQFREAKALNDAIKRLEGTDGKDKTPSNQTGINHSLHVHVYPHTGSKFPLNLKLNKVHFAYCTIYTFINRRNVDFI